MNAGGEGPTIAYLVNQYPQPSHTFIRREIAALEARGWRVERFTLRAVDGPLADEADRRERARVRAVLAAGAPALLTALLASLATRPRAFAAAVGLAMRLHRRSRRGLPAHLAYLAEACLLRRWLAGAGARHLHAHFGTNSAAVAMLCRALGGPPYSLTVHGPEEFDAPEALAIGAKVGRAAFAVAISHYGRSQLCRWTDPADWPRLHVVRCGVDRAFLGEGPSPVPSSTRLACVARLSEQKGLPALIEAAATLRDRGHDFAIDLIGDGPLRGLIERQVADHGLGDRVRLLGTLDGEGVRRSLRDARAFVLPSFAEGLPVVLMEALALGRPVVSTYVAGIPELVRPGLEGWLVPAGSAEALAVAIAEALAADPEELTRMGRSGADRVADRHDIEAEAAVLSALIAASAGVPEPGGRAGRPALAVPTATEA